MIIADKDFFKIKDPPLKIIKTHIPDNGGSNNQPWPNNQRCAFFHSTKYHQDEISLERSSSNVNQFSLYILRYICKLLKH